MYTTKQVHVYKYFQLETIYVISSILKNDECNCIQSLHCSLSVWRRSSELIHTRTHIQWACVRVGRRLWAEDVMVNIRLWHKALRNNVERQIKKRKNGPFVYVYCQCSPWNRTLLLLKLVDGVRLEEEYSAPGCVLISITVFAAAAAA